MTVFLIIQVSFLSNLSYLSIKYIRIACLSVYDAALCQNNSFLTRLIVTTVKKELPDTKIYIWTGNKYEELLHSSDTNMREILKTADVLIDGPYIQAERDITLPMRGSRNQRIINLREVYHEKV